MNLKYVAVAVVVIAVAIIGVVLALRMFYKPMGPTFNELFAYASNNTYTANYNYYIYSNIAGQVSTEDYLFTYSQRGLRIVHSRHNNERSTNESIHSNYQIK
ncbi:hypothetical protein [Vulcanisaeta sp. JCM 16161]|uniref:hypothetical protein n=1 Tax=Vulcanisaeta sp. JCM 16161 TaxID=1295372 RepID=UPI0006D168BE|nr:hypothetical protein [Vulcanisaeta sp. JCM 16161]